MDAARTTCLSLALTVLLAVSPGAWGQSDAAALRDYYSGNGLLNRELYDLAAAEYRKFLESRPDHDKAPHARYGLAVCLVRLDRHDEAVQDLGALADREGFEFAAEVLMLLGQSELALGRPDPASAAFGRVIREHSAHDLADEAAALQAEAFYEAGKLDQVERPCKLLASRWPDSPHRERADLLLGHARMALGDYESAAEWLESMSRRYPRGEYAHRIELLLAQSLHRSGDADGAAIRYQQVIDAANDTLVPEAMYGLAAVRHAGGRLAPAGALLDELLGRHPDADIATAARLLRGRIWFDQEDYDRALAQLAPLSKADGDYRDDAVYWIAKCRLRQGRHDEAAAELERALQRFPESDLAPHMTYDRAVALVRGGDREGALAILESFGTRYPDHELAPEALHLAASALHQERRYDESLAVCRVFSQEQPTHDLAPAVAFLAAENLYLLEDYREASGAYRALLERYRDHDQADQARYRLGLSLYQLDSFDEAETLLRGVTDGRDTPQRFRLALLALGDGSFQRGDWEAAETHLSDYLSFGLAQPSADDALLKLGLARQRQGEHRSALRSFNRLDEAFAQSPHRGHAIFESGQVLVELERFDDAEAAFRRVLEDGDDTPLAAHSMNHLGALARRDGRHREAASWFGRAAETLGDPGAATEARYQQGQALMSARRFGEAAAVLGELVRQTPDHGRADEAAALYAIALARRGDEPRHAEALAAINKIESRSIDELEFGIPSVGIRRAHEGAVRQNAADRLETFGHAHDDVLATTMARFYFGQQSVDHLLSPCNDADRRA